MDDKYKAVIAALCVACTVFFTGTTVYMYRNTELERDNERLTQRIAVLERDKDVLSKTLANAEELTQFYKESNDVLRSENEELTRAFEETSFALDEIAYETGWTELGEFRLTFYCPCEKCCGKWASGITATGTTATEGRTIAVDPKIIPLGSEVRIGDRVYIAEDTGVSGRTIDIFVNDHQEALRLGVQSETVAYRKGD